MGDYGNTGLLAQHELMQSGLSGYMTLPLSPIVFPEQQSLSKSLLLQHLKQGNDLQDSIKRVTPVSYGVNSVRYEVNLDVDATVVLNEIWFLAGKGKFKPTAKRVSPLLTLMIACRPGICRGAAILS